jgi:four helix bundle protein
VKTVVSCQSSVVSFVRGDDRCRKGRKKLAAQSFRELVVWQRAMQLTVAIYTLTMNFPPSEQFGLSMQLRRAAVSVPSNIAERQGRLHVGEFKQFLGLARGSNFEIQTQLEIAKALKYGVPARIKEAEGLSHEVGKMIYALLGSI